MHISVLLNESIEGLNLKEDGIYLDCTLGYAGHSSEILKRIKKGYLFAIDQDKDAIKASEEKLTKIGSNFTIIKSNFRFLKDELQKRNVNFVDGILFDLGVSSVQLDETERGFSYHNDAKLDMRMDQDAKLSAYDVVNNYDESKLREIFSAHDMEPMLELSIKENELVGNLSFYNVKPVEVRTMMPRNLKSFFKKLLEIANTQIEVDKLERQIWNIVQNEKYTKSLQSARYKELMKEDQELPRSIVLLFDPKYAILTDKLIELDKEKRNVMELLTPLKKKLANIDFKFKIR